MDMSMEQVGIITKNDMYLASITKFVVLSSNINCDLGTRNAFRNT